MSTEDRTEGHHEEFEEKVVHALELIIDALRSIGSDAEAEKRKQIIDELHDFVVNHMGED
jgi:hypothetical protein